MGHPFFPEELRLSLRCDPFFTFTSSLLEIQSYPKHCHVRILNTATPEELAPMNPECADEFVRAITICAQGSLSSKVFHLPS